MEYNDKVIERYMKTHSQADREVMIIEYAKLAKLIAGQMFAKNANPMLERSDYESYAILGLIDAVSRYNEDIGVKFETYASHRIRGTILDELRKFDNLSRTVRDNQKQYKSYQAKAIETYGTNYTRKQLLETNGITDQQLTKIERDVHIEEAVSLDGLTCNESDDLKYDPKDETHYGDGEYQILQKDLAKCLQEALSDLTEVERKVILLIYYEDLTQAEAAEVLGVTASRISIVNSTAIKKLRKSNALVGWLIDKQY